MTIELFNTSNVSQGTFATIQDAVNAASTGFTISIGAGTYNESVSISTALNFVGAGAGSTIIAPPSGSAFDINGDLGTSETLSIDGVSFTGGVAGVDFDDNAILGTLSITNSAFEANTSNGVRIGGNPSPVDLDNVVITDSTFTGNGQPGGSSGDGDILFFQYNGDATLSNLQITGQDRGTGPAENGIQFRGDTGSLGNVSLSDITVAGVYEKQPVAFFNYDDLNGLSASNVVITADSTSFQLAINFDGIDGDFSLAGFDTTGAPDPAVLQGDASSQEITGGASNDVLVGEGGDDTLNGEAGDDTLFGGADNDVLNSGSGADSVDGGDGDDTIDGGNKNDTLSGGLGDDSIIGSFGSDEINGGDDDDTLQGDGGRDTLDGGAGNDSLDGGDLQDSLIGGDGEDTLNGGKDNDTLLGGANKDFISGNGGDDEIEGASGADTLNGNGGDDTITGGRGDDFINGGGGDDDVAVYSGNFADYAITDDDGSPNVATIVDTVGTQGTDSVRNVEFLQFDDTLISVAEAANDGPTAEDDAIDVLETVPFSGDLFADNGSGADSDPDDAFTVTAVNGAAVVGSQITLGSGALLTVNADGSFDYDANGAFDALDAGDTDTDSFTYEITDGFGASDTATVAITIEGELNVRTGGPGDDTITGGAGEDVVDYSGATGPVIVNLDDGTATGEGDDTLIDIENVTGSDFADQITGDAGDNVLNGGEGSDLLISSNNPAGPDGCDTFVFDNLVGSDTVIGFDGAEDKIDISDLVTDFETGVDDISDFVRFQLTFTGFSFVSAMFVDTDGAGSSESFQLVAQFNDNFFLDPQTLFDNDQLIVGETGGGAMATTTVAGFPSLFSAFEDDMAGLIQSDAPFA